MFSAMSYHIDLHCHSWFSGDGVSSPESLIASARKKGLHGFALTDHDTSDGFRYLLEKGLARGDGLPVDDFLIIPGVEVSTAEGHLLCLGVMLPYLKHTPAIEVCKLVHDAGGVAIPAHPYDRFRAGIREAGELDPRAAYPEARDEIEARMLAALARAASPLAVDVLMDQPRR